MSKTTSSGRLTNRSTAATKRNYKDYESPTSQLSTVRRRTPADAISSASGGGGAGDAWLNSSVGAKRTQGRFEKPTIASTMRASCNLKKRQESAVRLTKSGKLREGAGSYTERKPLTTAAKSAARARLWPQRKPSNKDNTGKSTKKGAKSKANDKEPSDDLELLTTKFAKNLQESGIQTNEAEILNHDLLIGDIKLMLPSKNILAQLEKKRSEASVSLPPKIKTPPIRKLDAFEEGKEAHLSELEEFMERNCVKKRPTREPINTFNQSAILRSMDELLTRDVPRAESVTEIRERIRRKENELMQLFDEVDDVDEVKEKSPNGSDDA